MELVARAQSGDRVAREQLIAAHLPLLYNIVGRALNGHADIDDVVQETLVRVIRDLPALRAPESFRSWLVAIAVRQIATHRQRVRTAVDRATVVDTADLLPTAGDLEDEAILRLHLADQRRQVVEATRWLDPAQRPMLSLWWQECVGQLSRSEVAAACDASVAHVAVRLQRLREQLELGRLIVAALAAEPRCPGLAATVDRWDGQPTPVWRKRIARHVRDCRSCATPAQGQVPAERLLLGIAPLAVPAGLAATLAAKGLLTTTAATTPVLAAAHTATTYTAATAPAAATAGGGPGALFGKLAQAVVAHPVASLAAGAALIGGTAATVALQPNPRPPVVVVAPSPAAPTTSSPTPPPPSRRPSAEPSPTRPPVPAGTVPLGSWSLESAEGSDRYLSHDGEFVELGRVAAASAEPARRRATFTVGRGLADSSCVTLRAADGRYLRHWGLRLQLSPNEGTEIFRADATFCPRRSSVDGAVTLRSHNYPALVLHHRDGGLWLDLPDGSRDFAVESSFIVRDPWA
ncbi:sigma-70 family RNA polymerase sigma factor [Micromonospora radicis]|uniref:RNA polymerase sigma factor n=1 Tax=Micromonospora radicis TaxID=1894971 RepID=A0A418N086_9ACTN|nr:sigma-70 family RNA polymerase sigma factor [Micromonospora radicis]